MRAAPDVIRSLVAARAYADLGTPVLEQLAVNWLLNTGGWQSAVDMRRSRPGRTATRWSPASAVSCPAGSSRCRGAA
ncbi:hypothetical protein SALBM135S_01497 [Streptomyces alboniger]